MTAISRSSAISLVQAMMVTPINQMAKWALDNDPTGAGITQAIPNPLNWDMAGGQIASSYPYDSSITSASLNKLELIEIMRNTAVYVSHIRMVRLQKSNYPYTAFWYDNTAPANMWPPFGLSITSIPYPTPGVVDGGVEMLDITRYAQELNTVVTNWRNTTLSYVEKYCHSNCHSNCHGNRGRR